MFKHIKITFENRTELELSGEIRYCINEWNALHVYTFPDDVPILSVPQGMYCMVQNMTLIGQYTAKKP